MPEASAADGAEPGVWASDGGTTLVVCGPGTVLMGTKCELAPDSGAGGGPTQVVCGPGTVLVGTKCELRPGDGEGGEQPQITCGAGTVLVGGICEVAPIGPKGEAKDAGASQPDANGEPTDAFAPNSRDAGDGAPGLNGPPLGCGSRDVTFATKVSGPITGSTTWSGIIWVTGDLSLRNEAVLKIEPGTKIIVGSGFQIEAGAQGSHPTLLALGTPEAPIRFCGETDTAGYWAGIVVQASVNPNSTFQNVLIAEGGKTDAAFILNAPIDVQGIQVRSAGVDGVRAVGFGANSRSLVVNGAGRYPVVASAIGGVEIPPDSDLRGNGTDLVRLAFTGFDRSGTFRNIGIPFAQPNDIKGPSSGSIPVTLRWEAGVEYQLGREATLDSGRAAIVIHGTSAAPVVFRGFPCTRVTADCLYGDTYPYAQTGRLLIAQSSVGSEIQYANFTRGGWVIDHTYSTEPVAALEFGTSSEVLVDHVQITDAVGYGLRVTGKAPFAPGSQALSIATTRSSIDLSFEHSDCAGLVTLPANTSVSPTNGRVNVDCWGISTSGTIRALNAPYTFRRSLSLASGSAVNIEAGAKFSMLPSTELAVLSGASLHAIGTAASPIQFLRASEGRWTGIRIESNDTVLDHLVIDGAGGSGWEARYAAVWAKTPLSLMNSTIKNASGYGVLKTVADTTDYAATNTFSGNTMADVGSY